MSINDLSDTQYENLWERCLVDEELILKFLKSRESDFTEWCEKYPRQCDNTKLTRFLEKHNDELIAEGFKKYYAVVH